MPQEITYWTKQFFLKTGLPFYFYKKAISSNQLAKNQAFKTQNLSPKALSNQLEKSQAFKAQNFDKKNLKSSNFKESKSNQSHFEESNPDQLHFEESNPNQSHFEELNFKTSPSVFLVAHQTQGRGQGHRVWQNSDLMISFLWDRDLKNIYKINSKSFAQALSVALKNVWPALPLTVKAPNDLLLNQKKLAGILLEVISQGPKTALIVGLGLNVFSHPKNLVASHLAENTKNINPKTWEFFLTQLLFLWNKTLKKI